MAEPVTKTSMGTLQRTGEKKSVILSSVLSVVLKRWINFISFFIRGVSEWVEKHVEHLNLYSDKSIGILHIFFSSVHKITLARETRPIYLHTTLHE